MERETYVHRAIQRGQSKQISLWAPFNQQHSTRRLLINDRGSGHARKRLIIGKMAARRRRRKRETEKKEEKTKKEKTEDKKGKTKEGALFVKYYNVFVQICMRWAPTG